MGTLRREVDETSVHLCIDMQRLFASGGPWETPWLTRVLPIVSEIVARKPDRTIFTRFIPAKSASEAPGNWRLFYEKWADVTLDRIDSDLVDLLPSLKAFVPPAKRFDRTTYSVFADGRLHAALQKMAVDTVVFSGSETDVCVLASVLDAVDHGYRTIVVSDALASSSDQSHDALIALYKKRFDIQIELCLAEELTRAWNTR